MCMWMILPKKKQFLVGRDAKTHPEHKIGGLQGCVQFYQLKHRTLKRKKNEINANLVNF